MGVLIKKVGVIKIVKKMTMKKIQISKKKMGQLF